MTKGSGDEEAERQPNGRTKGGNVARIASPDAGRPSAMTGSGSGGAAGASTAITSSTATGPTLKNSSAARTDDVIIGGGVTANGKLYTAGGVFVDGILRDADVEASTFSVSREGVFHGRATAQRVEIAGSVEGELCASDEIVLRSSSTVSGRLTAPYIVVHRGAVLSGATTTLTRKSQAPAYLYAPQPSFGRRRFRLGTFFVSAALVVTLSSAAAFALLAGT